MAALSSCSDADHFRVKGKVSWFIEISQICVAQVTDKVYEQLAITWVNVDTDPYHHLVSLGQNELIQTQWSNVYLTYLNSYT